MRINAITLNLTPQVSIRSTSAFANYREGDLLRAQIVDINENTIHLKMSDGKLMTAQLRSALPILPGDSLDLLVSSKLPQQLKLQITSLNGQSIKPEVSPLQSLLLQSGIECTPQNTEAARVLQQLALPLLPSSLTAMTNALSRYPDLPPAQAAFMTANAIPIDEKNIAVVRTWLESSPTIDQVAQPILDYIAVLPAEKPVSLPQLNHPLQAAPDGLSRPASLPVPEGTPPDQSVNPIPAQKLNYQAEKISPAIEPESAKDTAPLNGSSPLLRPFLLHLDKDAAATVSTASDELVKVLSLPVKERSTAAFAFVKSLPQTPVAVKASILSALLGVSHVPDSKRGLPDKLSPPLLAAEDVNPLPLDEAAGKVQSDPISKLVTELFAKLSPKSDENAAQLQKAAETANEKLHAIRTLLPDPNSDSSKTLSAHLEQQISQNKIGSELNNFYYTQLPFRFNEHEQTAELYVIKRDPSKKKINEDNVTILMALSTENLGQVDSILKVSQNNLQVQMCVGKPEVRSYLKEQIPLLRELIASTPYTLQSFTVKGIETPLTPLSVSQIVQKELGATVSGLDISV